MMLILGSELLNALANRASAPVNHLPTPTELAKEIELKINTTGAI
jgi:hypothetical protein